LGDDARIQLFTNIASDRLTFPRVKAIGCNLPRGIPCILFPNGFNVLFSTLWSPSNPTEGGVLYVNKLVAQQQTDEELLFWIAMFMNRRSSAGASTDRLVAWAMLLCVITVLVVFELHLNIIYGCIGIVFPLFSLLFGAKSGKQQLMGVGELQVACRVAEIDNCKAFLLGQASNGNSELIRHIASRLIRDHVDR